MKVEDVNEDEQHKSKFAKHQPKGGFLEDPLVKEES